MVIFLSCVSDVQPKPKAYFSLKYPKANYKKIKSEFDISFEYNSIAELRFDQKSSRLLYPNMKATLYLNYKSVKNNLDSLLNDAYKIPYKHISKADAIPEKIFINKENDVYGTLFSIIGDAASQHQFFLTDSVNHFLANYLEGLQNLFFAFSNANPENYFYNNLSKLIYLLKIQFFFQQVC